MGGHQNRFIKSLEIRILNEFWSLLLSRFNSIWNILKLLYEILRDLILTCGPIWIKLLYWMITGIDYYWLLELSIRIAFKAMQLLFEILMRYFLKNFIFSRSCYESWMTSILNTFVFYNNVEGTVANAWILDCFLLILQCLWITATTAVTIIFCGRWF